MKKIICGFALLVAAAASISACSGGGSASAAPSATPVVPSPVPPVISTPLGTLPPEPNRAANNATLAGIDTTGTGVRDDVHRLIFNTYTSTVKRKIGMAVAKGNRGIFLTPPQTTAEARAVRGPWSRAEDCLWSRDDISVQEASSFSRMIEAAHIDTGARMKAYKNYNHLLHGEGFNDTSNKNSCAEVLK